MSGTAQENERKIIQNYLEGLTGHINIYYRININAPENRKQLEYLFANQIHVEESL